MKYFLIALLVVLVALFVWLISLDTKEKDKEEAEKNKKNTEQKKEKHVLDSVKRECFETYRQQLIDERSYGLYKAALSENAALMYLQELFAFRTETEEHRLMSHEYRKQLAERILDPMKKTVSEHCPFKNGEYTVPQTFDVFLTPEEYYDQQMSYRGNSVIYQTDQEFWQERLDLAKKKRMKLAAEPANALWSDLWRRVKPLLEEADGKYRAEIEEAASREAALLYTKDLCERFEQELYRSGISVVTYYGCTPGERAKFFRNDSGKAELPAIVRESDGLVYAKGNHVK